MKPNERANLKDRLNAWLSFGAKTAVQLTFRQRLAALILGTCILAIAIVFFAFYTAQQSSEQRRILHEIIQHRHNTDSAYLQEIYARHEAATRNIQSITFGALLLLLFFDALMAFLVYKEHIARFTLKAHRRIPYADAQRKLATMQRFISVLETAGVAALASKTPALEDFIRSCRADKGDLEIIEAEEPLVETHIEMVDELTKKNILTPLVISTNARIQANKTLIKAALRQLVLNAAQAVGTNGRIVFRAYDKFAKFHGHHRRVVYLLIEDNGPGIPDSVQQHLYQHFYSTKEDRFGFGLSIVQRIAEAHGAEVHYETQKNKGTSFALVLPAIDDEEPDKNPN